MLRTHTQNRDTFDKNIWHIMAQQRKLELDLYKKGDL
jgi:hypothetical protein